MPQLILAFLLYNLKLVYIVLLLCPVNNLCLTHYLDVRSIYPEIKIKQKECHEEKK